MAGRTWEAGYEAFAYHGGALDVARRLCPEAPEPWIDLSTGVNPHAYPLPDLAPDIWTRLPDSDALAGLEAVAASRYGAKREAVVAGPGSQALIQTLARIAPKGAVAALGPTYRGHAEAFAAAGVRLLEAASLDTLAEVDVAVVVNPNNPDGRVASRVDLLDLHERLARRGGWLIVDEAFADFDEPGREPRAGPAAKGDGRPALVRQGLRTCRTSSRIRHRLDGHRRAPCVRPWARGRSADRRSRSAGRRSPIRTGPRR